MTLLKKYLRIFRILSSLVANVTAIKLLCRQKPKIKAFRFLAVFCIAVILFLTGLGDLTSDDRLFKTDSPNESLLGLYDNSTFCFFIISSVAR